LIFLLPNILHLHVVRNFSIDDVSGTYGRDSSSYFDFRNIGMGKIMLDLPEGSSAGYLMLESKIAGLGAKASDAVRGSLEWNVQTPKSLVFVGLNVSDKRNMIKLVKVDDKYRGDLQLDSYIWKLLRSIQELVANLVKEQNKEQNNGMYDNNVGSTIPLIPLLGNIQVHVDGKLQVVSSSKW
jgi:hypothetical protein